MQLFFLYTCSCLFISWQSYAYVYDSSKSLINEDESEMGEEVWHDLSNNGSFSNLSDAYIHVSVINMDEDVVEDDVNEYGSFAGSFLDAIASNKHQHKRLMKREIQEYNDMGMRVYNVGVLMASHLDSPFDLERCGPAVDLALHVINEQFLRPHNITLRKVQARSNLFTNPSHPDMRSGLRPRFDPFGPPERGIRPNPNPDHLQPPSFGGDHYYM